MFAVFQQRHPTAEGDQWVANVKPVREVEVKDATDAIAQARQWPEFRRAKSLASFPMVQPRE